MASKSWTSSLKGSCNHPLLLPEMNQQCMDNSCRLRAASLKETLRGRKNKKEKERSDGTFTEAPLQGIMQSSLTATGDQPTVYRQLLLLSSRSVPEGDAAGKQKS